MRARAVASGWVAETLSRRRALLAEVADGTVGLAEAIAACDSDGRLGGLKMLTIVEACPGRKKVLTRRSFASIGIDEFATVREVDGSARAALIALNADGSIPCP